MAACRPRHESSIFVDARAEGRALRVTWHHEGSGEGDPDDVGLVVLSLWRANVCTGSFRLRADEVPELVEALKRGLASTYDDLRSDTSALPRIDPLVDTA